MSTSKYNAYIFFQVTTFFVAWWLDAEGKMWLSGFERNTVWYNAQNCSGIQAQAQVCSWLSKDCLGSLILA